MHLGAKHMGDTKDTQENDMYSNFLVQMETDGICISIKEDRAI